jgi:hypothetical protein
MIVVVMVVMVNLEILYTAATYQLTDPPAYSFQVVTLLLQMWSHPDSTMREACCRQ